MANSNTTKMQKISKPDGTYNSETSLNEKYSLKSCHVLVTKIAGTSLDNTRTNSEDSVQSIAIPSAENRVHSNIPQINIDKSFMTSTVAKKSVSSKDFIKYSHIVSTSSSFGNVCDSAGIKSCYVALERLTIPPYLLQESGHCLEKEDKNIKICDSIKHIDCENITSNADVDCNYTKIQKSSFETNLLNPCYKSRSVHNKYNSDVNQLVLDSSNQHAEDNTDGSFVSLSFGTYSSDETEINQNILESDTCFIPRLSSTFGGNKKIVKRNSNHSVSMHAKRRRISSLSSTSVEDTGKDMKILNCNQNNVKANESLPSVHCGYKEAEESGDIRLLSSSSDCSTEKNFKNYSFRDQDGFTPGISLTSSLNKRTSKRNRNHSVSMHAKRRRISSLSSSSVEDTGKDVKILNCNQNNVKACESLPSVHCGYKEAEESGDIRLLSSSSDCSTEKNFKNYSFRDQDGVESNSRFTPGISLTSSLNKRTAKRNSNHSISKYARKRISFCSTSLEDTDKDVKLLNYKQNSVKTNESLPPVHCTGKQSKECDDLKCYVNRNTKSLRVRSERSTVTNIKKYSLRDRKSAYFQQRKVSKCRVKRNFSYSETFDVLSDSDSTAFNSSLAITNSYKQDLKKSKIEVGPTSPASCSQTALNVKRTNSSAVCKQRNSLDEMFDKNGNSFTSKYKSCSTENEENFSDTLNKSFNNAHTKRLKYKQSKHSCRGKHSKAKRVYLSKTTEVCTSSEKTILSDKSNNSEKEQECKGSFKYDLKPCSVVLVNLKKNHVISNTAEQFNILNQKDLQKTMLKMDCHESNSGEHMKYIENKSFGGNISHITAKECTVLTELDHLLEPKRSRIEKCSDYINTISVHELQDQSIESDYETLNKQVKKIVHISDNSSNSIKNKRISSYMDNITDDSDVATDIEIIGSRKYSSVNKESEKLLDKVNHNDPDWDDAYLADSDGETDINQKSASENYSVSEDVCKTSADLSVNLSRNEIDDKDRPRKIPYCCLGSKKASRVHENIFLFRSKINGTVYIVDVFEYENIKKMFVTIHWKKSSLLCSNNHHDRNSLPTVSERIKAVGGFDRVDAKSCLTNHGILWKKHHENKQKCPGKENISSANTSHVVDKGKVSSTKKDYSESLDTDCSKPGPSCSLSKSRTLSTTTSSDISDENKYDDFCVHCCTKFTNKKENYHHTCGGKLQKGFLCVYCEVIFSSYTKLQCHKAQHFI